MTKPLSPITAFCHVPKTGGVFLTSLLRGVFGRHHLDTIPRRRQASQIFEKSDLEFDLGFYKSVKSIAGHALTPSHDYGTIGSRLRWITILREPKNRFVSHYIHHVERHGFTGTIEEWDKRFNHGNHHCATISGKKDAKKTIELLMQFYAVGVLEEQADTYKILSAATQIKISDFVSKKPRNVQRGLLDKKKILEANLELVRKRNLEDQIVYDFAVNELLPIMRSKFKSAPQLQMHSSSRFTELICRLKRNLVYKPAVWRRERKLSKVPS